MNIKKIMYLAASTTLLYGCATQFTESDYEFAASMVAMANFCEKEGMLSRKEFQNYLSFQFYTAPSFNGEVVDHNKLQSMYLSKVERISSLGSPPTSADKERVRMKCAEIATVAERVSPSNSARQAPSGAVNSNTVNCKKMGEFLNVEIKTFSGAICPLGWLQAY